MSLIQEALHRRNTEIGQLKLSATPADAAPPPLPPAPPPPPPEPEHKTAYGKIIVLAVLLFALLGYGAWWFFLRPPEKPATSTAQPPPPPSPAVSKPAMLALPQPPINLIAQAKAKLETTRSPERLELVMGETNKVTVKPTPVTPAPPAPAPAVVVPTPAPPPSITNAPQQAAITNTTPQNVVTSMAPVVVKTPPTPEPTPKPPPAPVHWPKLNITGIMGRSGGDSVAFINGQILKVGDSIADARILAIAESGVQVVYQGETNTIRVGKGSE